MVRRIFWRTLWKVKQIYAFFMSQALVLSIKLATVNSVTYFGVSTVVMFSQDICRSWWKLKFEPSHGSGELFILQIKLANSNFILVAVEQLLSAAVSHEVKSSNYQCRNFNHQTYYSSPYWNHIWQSRFVLPLC